MIKKTITIFATLMLGLMIASCEKIERQQVITTSMDNIPLQYGRLLSATSLDQHRHILWFEQADQTIVGVRINVSRSRISEEVIRVERK